jgi:hypothetical protein
MADRNASIVSASGQRRKSVREEPVMSVLAGGDVPYDPDHEYNADEEVLAALGYKPEFKVGWCNGNSQIRDGELTFLTA